MNTSSPSRWVLAGLLLVASCVQPGLSRSALDLQSRRQAARDARVAVEHFRAEPAESAESAETENATAQPSTAPDAKASAARASTITMPAEHELDRTPAEEWHPPPAPVTDAPVTATRSKNQRQFTLRGYVLSSTAERTGNANEPLVVYAERQGSIASGGGDATQMDLPAVSHAEQTSAPGFAISSVGGTVRIENIDDICHAFFSTSGSNAFDLGVLDPGQTQEIKFEQQGIVHIYCTLHEGKQASVLVVPTRHHTTVAEDGSFAIAHVPAGEYMLSTWSLNLPTRRRRVTVTDERPEPILIDLKLEQGEEAQ